ncbi:hypothetical protein J6590_061439 [Homalodisca vitripennis]|nr:hypothetical protein J6590_061439 [Homalodisca vitripennis]
MSGILDNLIIERAELGVYTCGARTYCGYINTKWAVAFLIYGSEVTTLIRANKLDRQDTNSESRTTVSKRKHYRGVVNNIVLLRATVINNGLRNYFIVYNTVLNFNFNL